MDITVRGNNKPPDHCPKKAIVRDQVHRTSSRDPIPRSQPQSNVRVFGSVGRGEADAHDLDLLVEIAEDRNLFDLIAFSQELEDVLGIDVDVFTEAGLSPYLRERIVSEAVPL